ncbi:MAG: histidinol-phosphatase [Desulfobacterales bacterium]|nr:histidinol-phosphatase [Desulfobacterales bacterium]
MNNESSISNHPPVSVHGGHSGEFCNHALDTLEDIVQAYIRKNFAWIGITEHMPPVSDKFVFQEEADAGLDAKNMYQRFGQYISTCRELQKKYYRDIQIFVGFETETCTGYKEHVHKLIQEFQPDYIVGSVHHVDDMIIDATSELFARAVDAAGGIDALYCRYFDQQYEMLNTLKPAVVGHFDLIRMFDADYFSRLEKPEIQKRIIRNLECIKSLDLVMDFNLRAFQKGASEPYISKNILVQALEMGITVVPGDDSHGVNTVGLDMEKGISLLYELGFASCWRKPFTCPDALADAASIQPGPPGFCEICG